MIMVSIRSWFFICTVSLRPFYLATAMKRTVHICDVEEFKVECPDKYQIKVQKALVSKPFYCDGEHDDVTDRVSKLCRRKHRTVCWINQSKRSRKIPTSCSSLCHDETLTIDYMCHNLNENLWVEDITFCMAATTGTLHCNPDSFIEVHRASTFSSGRHCSCLDFTDNWSECHSTSCWMNIRDEDKTSYITSICSQKSKCQINGSIVVFIYERECVVEGLRIWFKCRAKHDGLNTIPATRKYLTTSPEYKHTGAKTTTEMITIGVSPMAEASNTKTRAIAGSVVTILLLLFVFALILGIIFYRRRKASNTSSAIAHLSSEDNRPDVEFNPYVVVEPQHSRRDESDTEWMTIGEAGALERGAIPTAPTLDTLNRTAVPPSPPSPLV